MVLSASNSGAVSTIQHFNVALADPMRIGTGGFKPSVNSPEIVRHQSGRVSSRPFVEHGVNLISRPLIQHPIHGRLRRPFLRPWKTQLGKPVGAASHKLEEINLRCYCASTPSTESTVKRNRKIRNDWQ